MRYLPIEAGALTELRQLDDAARLPEPYDDPEGGAPLRCCLRRSVAGERIALVAYAPLRRWAARGAVDPGAYDEQGPVFIHADPCAGPGHDRATYPVGLHGPRRVLRAYSAGGHILGGRLVEVDDPQAVPAILDEVWADPAVAVVHARAVEFGCFLFEVRKS